MGAHAINWNKSSWEQSENQTIDNDPETIEVYIIEGVKDGLAVSTTMVRYQNSELMGAVHVLGSTITPTPWAQSGLSLAAGLRYLEHVQLITHNKIGPLNKKGTLMLRSDYSPLHMENQVKRWKMYGAPEQPSPEHTLIDEILAKWTASPMLRTTIIKKKEYSKQQVKGYATAHDEITGSEKAEGRILRHKMGANSASTNRSEDATEAQAR